jgi:hypothetical protein
LLFRRNSLCQYLKKILWDIILSNKKTNFLSQLFKNVKPLLPMYKVIICSLLLSTTKNKTKLIPQKPSAWKIGSQKESNCLLETKVNPTFFPQCDECTSDTFDVQYSYCGQAVFQKVFWCLFEARGFANSYYVDII